MPARTVTLGVVALTEEANRRMQATGAYFEKLRAANPVELKVKLDRAQAIAESKIIASEMATTVRDTLKLSVDRAGIGGIRGLISGLGPAGANLGAGLFGAGGAAGGGGLAGIGAFLGTPGGAATGLGALPFLAQAAASVITFGLGGALAALGVYAEKGRRDVQYQFSQLVSGTQGIKATFANISPAFGDALHTVLNAARTFVPQFIRDFGPALDAIAGPLKSFGVEIAGTLAKPEIADSLREVGVAFGGILKALTPAIPGIVTAIADGITNIARAVARNPKAFADFAIALGHLAGIALDVIAWLTQVANFIEQRFVPVWLKFSKDLTVPFAVATTLAIAAPREFIRFGNIVTGLFTRTLPAAFGIFKESVRITFDQLEIIALNTVSGILAPFSHLPFGLGKPFTQARAAIGAELGRIRGDVADAVNNISASWARLNGQTSNLYLNIINPGPGGSTSINPFTRRYASGTVSAVPGWALVGERGPELLSLRGGETVIPSATARGFGAPVSVNVVLEVHTTGTSDIDRALTTWLQKSVTVRGGGSVQAAWGSGVG